MVIDDGWRPEGEEKFVEQKYEVRQEKPLGKIIHPVKPVWCSNCEAWHVECEYGCCAQTQSEED